jgi:hypothetical protein
MKMLVLLLIVVSGASAATLNPDDPKYQIAHYLMAQGMEASQVARHFAAGDVIVNCDQIPRISRWNVPVQQPGEDDFAGYNEAVIAVKNLLDNADATRQDTRLLDKLLNRVETDEELLTVAGQENTRTYLNLLAERVNRLREAVTNFHPAVGAKLGKALPEITADLWMQELTNSVRKIRAKATAVTP